jgi:hypothetical protein
LVGWAHIFNESEMARSSECKEQYAQKTLDTADIVRDVRDAIFRPSWKTSSAKLWRKIAISAIKVQRKCGLTCNG